MRLDALSPWVAAALLVAGCPKKNAGVEIVGKGSLVLTVDPRAPIRCSRFEKDESKNSVRTYDPSGCNASVRYRLAPTGEVDLDVPFFYGATTTTIGRRLDADSVIDRSIVLRDVAGQGVWEVVIPETGLPYGEACPRGEGAEAARDFDFNRFRFMVVMVRSRDTYGNLTPYVAGQDDSVALDLTMQTGATQRPPVFASKTHDGVWAVVWCDRGDEPASVKFNVRGAYQLETDAFDVPTTAGDTYTVVEYVVEPSERG